MNPDSDPEKKTNLEIHIKPPSSPLVPLHIHNFVKEINVPVEMKIQTKDRENTMTGGSENTTTDNSIFGYFKSFFQGFSQQSLQKKKHDSQNKSYLNSLFYSGNEAKTKESTVDIPSTEKEEVDIPSTEKEEVDIPSTEKEEVDIPSIEKEEEKEEVDIPPFTEENKVITKIILTTEDPETVLRESLKGTKLYYFAERKDLPSQWV